MMEADRQRLFGEVLLSEGGVVAGITSVGSAGGEDVGSISQGVSLAELDAEGYRALFDFSPDGVLFTSPDGPILAANPAACEIFGRTEEELRAIGRQGLADVSDERWAAMLQERESTGHGHAHRAHDPW